MRYSLFIFSSCKAWFSVFCNILWRTWFITSIMPYSPQFPFAAWAFSKSIWWVISIYRAARTLSYYLSETTPVVHQWLNQYIHEHPIPRDGSWDDISGDTFLRGLLKTPPELATGNWVHILTNSHELSVCSLCMLSTYWALFWKPRFCWRTLGFRHKLFLSLKIYPARFN